MCHGRSARSRALVKLVFRSVIAVALQGGSLIWLSPAYGQEAPGGDESLRRQDQQLQELRRRQEATPDVHMQAAPPEPVDRLPSNEGPCRHIRKIQAEGGGALSAAVIGALAGTNGDDAPEGRCLGSKGIAILVQRANNALIGKGYVTSRVEALSQSLNDGELVLTILPGLIEEIRYAQGEGSNVSPAGASLAAEPGSVLNLRDIEQTLENFRRVSGADAGIAIEPGSREGYSVIVIHYQRPRPFGLTLTLDDNGAKATGRWQSGATLAWNSPLGLSDLFYISASKDLPVSTSRPRHGSNSQTVHYSLPRGYWLFSTTVSASAYERTLPGGFGNRYIGESEVGEFQVQRVMHRGTFSKSSLSVKAFWRQSSNFINDEELTNARRRMGGWELAASHLHYLGAGSLDAHISYRRGTGAFGAVPAAEEASGEGTSRMRIVQGSLGIWMPFALGGWAPAYSGQLRMQSNAVPLTAQDRMCIGGRFTVRGFDGEQALCANRGQILRNELALPMPGWPGPGHSRSRTSSRSRPTRPSCPPTWSTGCWRHAATPISRWQPARATPTRLWRSGPPGWPMNCTGWSVTACAGFANSPSAIRSPMPISRSAL